MASPPAGAQILYVFVQESREAGQERFKHCFPYISNPGDKVKALCRAVQRKSRAQGVLGQDERISALRLVYRNQPEVTLVREELLAIACRMLQDTGGEHWQMHGPGVWPRIVAVIGEKKRRSQLAEERDGGQDDVDASIEEPGSAEEEIQRRGSGWNQSTSKVTLKQRRKWQPILPTEILRLQDKPSGPKGLAKMTLRQALSWKSCPLESEKE